MADWNQVIAWIILAIAVGFLLLAACAVIGMARAAVRGLVRVIRRRRGVAR